MMAVGEKARWRERYSISDLETVDQHSLLSKDSAPDMGDEGRMRF